MGLPFIFSLGMHDPSTKALSQGLTSRAWRGWAQVRFDSLSRLLLRSSERMWGRKLSWTATTSGERPPITPQRTFLGSFLR